MSSEVCSGENTHLSSIEAGIATRGSLVCTAGDNNLLNHMRIHDKEIHHHITYILVYAMGVPSTTNYGKESDNKWTGWVTVIMLTLFFCRWLMEFFKSGLCMRREACMPLSSTGLGRGVGTQSTQGTTKSSCECMLFPSIWSTATGLLGGIGLAQLCLSGRMGRWVGTPCTHYTCDFKSWVRFANLTGMEKGKDGTPSPWWWDSDIRHQSTRGKHLPSTRINGIEITKTGAAKEHNLRLTSKFKYHGAENTSYCPNAFDRPLFCSYGYLGCERKLSQTLFPIPAVLHHHTASPPSPVHLFFTGWLGGDWIHDTPSCLFSSLSSSSLFFAAFMPRKNDQPPSALPSRRSAKGTAKSASTEGEEVEAPALPSVGLGESQKGPIRSPQPPSLVLPIKVCNTNKENSTIPSVTVSLNDSEQDAGMDKANDSAKKSYGIEGFFPAENLDSADFYPAGKSTSAGTASLAGMSPLDSSGSPGVQSNVGSGYSEELDGFGMGSTQPAMPLFSPEFKAMLGRTYPTSVFKPRDPPSGESGQGRMAQTGLSQDMSMHGVEVGLPKPTLTKDVEGTNLLPVHDTMELEIESHTDENMCMEGGELPMQPHEVAADQEVSVETLHGNMHADDDGATVASTIDGVALGLNNGTDMVQESVGPVHVSSVEEVNVGLDSSEGVDMHAHEKGVHNVGIIGGKKVGKKKETTAIGDRRKGGDISVALEVNPSELVATDDGLSSQSPVGEATIMDTEMEGLKHPSSPANIQVSENNYGMFSPRKDSNDIQSIFWDSNNGHYNVSGRIQGNDMVTKECDRNTQPDTLQMANSVWNSPAAGLESFAEKIKKSNEIIGLKLEYFPPRYPLMVAAEYT
ncbi:hypothetical protein L1987_39809 [Smallanthus sonchifolius]|uniref:Uncharacterized protein n=1 Tax=Smallanthus sonchifolius TaxID=185202 RepID=A0ACB9HP90_9ASTR|nr:hypothetical protein L1987_39809 [Smallanthus sonchifolius]